MDEYVEYLKEVFEHFGPVTVRRMFGGYGLYHDGLMFALVSDGALYLKADAENSIYFESAGLEPFKYSKNGKRVKIAYYAAPDEIMDDRERAALWAQRSFEAALRADIAKPRRRPRRGGGEGSYNV